MKDYPIGSVVVYDGDTLLVQAQTDNKPSCARCAFSNPHNRENAEKMLQKALSTNDSERAFTDPKIELYENYQKANESK